MAVVGTLVVILAIFFLIVLFSAIKVLREYERGVIFRLGRLIDQKGPGLILLIPFIDRMVKIDMTLTAPGCPVAGEMPGWVADAVESVPGVREVDVEMTFQPQWGMDMMSDEARLELGFI